MSKNKKRNQMQEALDEIKLAFENFCADAQAIIDEAKKKKSNKKVLGGPVNQKLRGLLFLL